MIYIPDIESGKMRRAIIEQRAIRRAASRCPVIKQCNKTMDELEADSKRYDVLYAINDSLNIKEVLIKFILVALIFSICIGIASLAYFLKIDPHIFQPFGLVFGSFAGLVCVLIIIE